MATENRLAPLSSLTNPTGNGMGNLDRIVGQKFKTSLEYHYRKIAWLAVLAQRRFPTDQNVQTQCSTIIAECAAHLNRPGADVCETCECGTILPGVENQNGHAECAECEGGFIG